MPMPFPTGSIADFQKQHQAFNTVLLLKNIFYCFGLYKILT